MWYPPVPLTGDDNMPAVPEIRWVWVERGKYGYWQGEEDPDPGQWDDMMADVQLAGIAPLASNQEEG